jgi:hypothetical protein
MSGADRVAGLTGEFARMARDGEIRCCAVVFDGRLRPEPERPSGTDAICITVEHEGGYVANVLVPYCIRDGEVTYEPMFATRTTPSVFT